MIKLFVTFLGEAISRKFVHRLRDKVEKNCAIWNIYGPAETTIVSTCYFIDFMSLDSSVALGRALPNYKCLIVDDLLQSVVVSQEGELYIGGVGVFTSYLG